jgi:hypothetical protein
LISEGHQIDTQGLVHWIEDTLLEMENQQAVDFAYDTADDLACGVLNKKDIEYLYNEFFKTK